MLSVINEEDQTSTSVVIDDHPSSSEDSDDDEERHEEQANESLEYEDASTSQVDLTVASNDPRTGLTTESTPKRHSSLTRSMEARRSLSFDEHEESPILSGIDGRTVKTFEELLEKKLQQMNLLDGTMNELATVTTEIAPKPSECLNAGDRGNPNVHGPLDDRQEPKRKFTFLRKGEGATSKFLNASTASCSHAGGHGHHERRCCTKFSRKPRPPQLSELITSNRQSFAPKPSIIKEAQKTLNKRHSLPSGSSQNPSNQPKSSATCRGTSAQAKNRSSLDSFTAHEQSLASDASLIAAEMDSLEAVLNQMTDSQRDSFLADYQDWIDVEKDLNLKNKPKKSTTATSQATSKPQPPPQTRTVTPRRLKGGKIASPKISKKSIPTKVFTKKKPTISPLTTTSVPSKRVRWGPTATQPIATRAPPRESFMSIPSIRRDEFDLSVPTFSSATLTIKDKIEELSERLLNVQKQVLETRARPVLASQSRPQTNDNVTFPKATESNPRPPSSSSDSIGVTAEQVRGLREQIERLTERLKQMECNDNHGMPKVVSHSARQSLGGQQNHQRHPAMRREPMTVDRNTMPSTSLRAPPRHLPKKCVERNPSRDVTGPLGNEQAVITEHENGTTVEYANGDTMKITPDSTVIYRYAANGCTQTTFPDGLKVVQFTNGQLERTYASGMKQICYPNGTQRVVYIDSSEEVTLPDGTKIRIGADGTETIEMPNGDREMRTSKYKRRIYRDGTTRTIYEDGTQETRYANGRLRIKDKEGKLVVDSKLRTLDQL